EQALPRTPWHPGTGIEQCNQNSFAMQTDRLAVATDMHPQLAPGGHGLDRVDDEIGENLSQLCRKSGDFALPTETLLDLNLLRSNLLVVKQHDSGDELHQIHRRHR